MSATLAPSTIRPQLAPDAIQEPSKVTTTDDLVLSWFDETARTVATAGSPTQLANTRIWAISWLAAARAVGEGSDPHRSAAAFATSLHGSLVATVPSRASALDDALADTLGSIPGGTAKTRGVAVGLAAADRVLTERGGDGLDVAPIDVPWSSPAPGPGVWRPIPGLFGGTVQIGPPTGRPFLSGDNGRFRPDPPPPLDSHRYLRDLAEVEDMGMAASTARMQPQTDVARFWTQTSLSAYTQVLRGVLADSSRPLSWRARTIAAFHVITIDALLAINEAKSVYARWRPVTAIHEGEIENDRSWRPLSVTPANPEYPSARAGYAAAAQRVLESLVGRGPTSPVTVTSPTASGDRRLFTDWSSVTRENIDARVWQGVNFRFSAEIGAAVGRQAASYDLLRLWQIGL